MDYWARTWWCPRRLASVSLSLVRCELHWLISLCQTLCTNISSLVQSKQTWTRVIAERIQDWQPALITNTACTESGSSGLFYSGHRLCTICSPIASSGEILHTLMEERRGICMKCFGIIHTDPQVEAWVPYRAFKMRTDSLKCKHTHLESIHTKASSHVHDF